jgi:DNA-binding transcriptional ArsR family regulator
VYLLAIIVVPGATSFQGRMDDPDGVIVSVVGEIPNGPALGARVGLDETFKALSDPTRREILRVLRSGDLTAGALSDQFHLARSTMSGHFNVLRSAGLIVSERNRNTIVYSLNMSAFDDAFAAMFEVLRTGERSRPDEEA